MTRSMEALWRNASARQEDVRVTSAARDADAAVLMRMKTALRAVIDWFTEY